MYEVEEDTTATTTTETTTKTASKDGGSKQQQQEKKPSEFMRVQRLFRQQTKNARGKVLPKDKRPPVDYSIVLDFSNLDKNTEENKALVIDYTDLVDKSDAGASEYYAHPSTWRVYGIKDYPGFYFIPSPFTSSQQKKWVKDSLEQYANVPNNTNINLFYGPVKDLWQHGQQEMITEHQQLSNQLLSDDDDNQETSTTSRPLDKDGKELPPYRELLDKLAWATLGYQFQWTPRIYSRDFYETFPDDLQDLVQKIAMATKYDPYIAEAGTVNFYSEDSVMGGHLDDAEEEMEKPIISLSFGASAVFLLGAETRDIAPIPLFIRSGDIVIMGGRSRYCYHGVAKIVENSFNVDLVDEADETFKYHIQWLREKNRRINVNTRQVFKKKEENNNSTCTTTSSTQ
ncbi:alkylated DNA repair protein [Cavenderia fasciculata]|uniref:Alkylated DNA repair protein n=1 Tax=Cavenderia fasciculata TaxID=261658 RepID=F4PTI9_CACFS|nr:alkylated DNA repair protein [Cavenderia fasciculata]EGG20871.1 alkylated DNA repair protein [Cavenderia fasciculata]|eukprot:XP_004358721.1 alkylated DNA repair protein [Cavenderia fasciculata]